MKKYLVFTLVIASIFLVACGSSISDSTRELATDQLGSLNQTLTNTLASLREVQDPVAAENVYLTFSSAFEPLVETEAELIATNDEYSKTAQDKGLKELVDQVSKNITLFENAVETEGILNFYAVGVGQRILADLEAAKFVATDWIKASQAAGKMVSDLTKLMDDTYNELNAAKSGKEAGDALVGYANTVKELSAQGKELEALYPEFKQAATDSSLEKPISDFRASMIKLGNELKEKEKQYKGDEGFDNGIKEMKEILAGLKETT